MIAKPRSAYAEGVRRLATSIGFADPDGEAKVVLVTSALQREGKSTTVANLGVALARAGNDVVLVDLDLRQPTLAGLFGISRLSGLTDVAVRKATLDDALVGIDVPAIIPGQARAAGQMSLRGSLCVLPSGPLPANPGEFAGSEAVASRILAPLRERFDYVIVDSPPMCVVGDASTLSPRVDAIVVVTRLAVLNRPSLRDLKRQLAAAPARKLGSVITGVDVPPAYGYAGYYEPTLEGAASNGTRPASRAPRTPA
jgi:capsular exopolysaccharide synthesis family protein